MLYAISMGTNNHTLYKQTSPYYQGILAQWGRWLTYSQVCAILDEHSLRADYIEEHGTPSAAADTDAAELLAWLGY